MDSFFIKCRNLSQKSEKKCTGKRREIPRKVLNKPVKKDKIEHNSQKDSDRRVSIIMSGIKQKNRVRQQRKRVQQHKRSMLGISAVIMLLVMVVSVSSISLQARNKEYIAQEKELEASIREEKDRAEEISELEDYVGTDEYIEQTAKDKLGLVHENEIIFKAR